MEQETKKIPIKKIAMIVFSVFSLTAFMQFMLEEAIQMHSSGLWPIISNKYISTAEKVKAVDEHKNFSQTVGDLMSFLTTINPFTGTFYDQFMEANKGKIENYYRSIYGIAPSEIGTIKQDCRSVKIGEKCFLEGRIKTINEEEKFTVFFLLNGEYEETEKTEENPEGRERIDWDTKLVLVPHELGELKEIFHLLRTPQEGDTIKVYGRKEIYKEKTSVKAGYLMITEFITENGFIRYDSDTQAKLLETKKYNPVWLSFVASLHLALLLMWFKKPFKETQIKVVPRKGWRYEWGKKPTKNKGRENKPKESQEEEEINVEELFKEVAEKETFGWKDVIDLILSGKLKMRAPKEIKNDWLETLGKGNYMRIFRNDRSLPSPDELATDYGMTEDELKEKIAERIRSKSFRLITA